jgi:hypothetical protein
VHGRSSTHRFITVPRPAPSTSLRDDSTVYQSRRLWPSAAKSFRGMSMFNKKIKPKKFLIENIFPPPSYF